MASSPPELSRWTYKDTEQSLVGQIEKKIIAHFLTNLDQAIDGVEAEIMARAKEDMKKELSRQIDSGAQPLPGEQGQQRESLLQKTLGKIVSELMHPGANMEHLRAAMGGMRHDIAKVLTKDEEYRPTVERLPNEIFFSIEVLLESIDRVHGQGLSDFSTRWAQLVQQEKKHDHYKKTSQYSSIYKGEKVKAKHIEEQHPLNISWFCDVVYQAEQKQGLSKPLQIMLFLHIEQQLVQSINFLLFEISNLILDKSPVLPTGLNGGKNQNDLDGFFNEDLTIDVDGKKAAILRRQEVLAHQQDRPVGVNDEVLFNSLCELLKSWEPGEDEHHVMHDGAGSAVRGDGRRPLKNHEMFSAISALQRWVPKVIEDALGHRDGRLANSIKDTLLKQAEAMGAPAGQTKISMDDELAVDLVDEVFTENLYERRMQQASRTIIAQMLFPSVKAAILNRRWFSEDNHPARKFLVSMSDACAPKEEHGEQEPAEEVMKKASEMADRLAVGFNEDVSIFEVLAQELQEFLDTRSARMDPEVAKDAARRRKIWTELELRWKNWSGPEPVRSFCLEIGWEYLYILDKNNERGSLKWSSTWNILDQLMHLRSEKNNPVKIDGVLRDGLMRMLTLSGWTGVRAHARLAEQEDAIHAYYALGVRNFDSPSIDIQKMLDEAMNQSVSKKVAHNKNPEAAQDEAKKIAILGAPSVSILGGLEAKPFERPKPLLGDDVLPVIPVSPTVFTEPLSIIQPKIKTPEPAAQDTPEAVEQLNEAFDQLISDWSGSDLHEPQAPSQDDLDRHHAEQHQAQEPIAVTPSAPTLDLSPAVPTPSPSNASSHISSVMPNSMNADTVMSKIMGLAMGSSSTWINESGEAVVLKLSWVSPISMKYLFVNKMGARVLVVTPQELADLAHKGRFFPDAIPKNKYNL